MKAASKWFTGDFFGTFLLVFFGGGSVAAAVTTGAQVGVFQANGLGWLTVYLVAPLLGGLLGGGISRAFFKAGYVD